MRSLVRHGQIGFVALALALAGLGFVRVPPAEATCSQASIQLYESNNFGGQSVTFCMQTDGALINLAIYTWPDGHNCDRYFPVFPAASYNDCMSSWKVNVANCHYRVYLYANTNGTGLMFNYNYDIAVVQPGIGYQDALSSIRFRYDAHPC